MNEWAKDDDEVVYDYDIHLSQNTKNKRLNSGSLTSEKTIKTRRPQMMENIRRVRNMLPQSAFVLKDEELSDSEEEMLFIGGTSESEASLSTAAAEPALSTNGFEPSAEPALSTNGFERATDRPSHWTSNTRGKSLRRLSSVMNRRKSNTTSTSTTGIHTILKRTIKSPIPVENTTKVESSTPKMKGILGSAISAAIRRRRRDTAFFDTVCGGVNDPRKRSFAIFVILDEYPMPAGPNLYKAMLYHVTQVPTSLSMMEQLVQLPLRTIVELAGSSKLCKNQILKMYAPLPTVIMSPTSLPLVILNDLYEILTDTQGL